MANKQNFTPDEWTKVLQSGMLASMAVTAAEPSGLWGTLMETFAGGSAFAASKHDPSANDLIKSVIADFETVQGRAAVQEALRKGFGGVKQAEICRALARPFAGGLGNPRCQSTRRCRCVQSLAARYQPKGRRGVEGRQLPRCRRSAS